MNNEKKVETKNDGVNPLVAGITGAIIGAGIVAGAVVLNDKNTQEKVKIIVNDVKEKAESMIEDSKAKIAEDEATIKDAANKTIDKLNDKAKAVVNG